MSGPGYLREVRDSGVGSDGVTALAQRVRHAVSIVIVLIGAGVANASAQTQGAPTSPALPLQVRVAALAAQAIAATSTGGEAAALLPQPVAGTPAIQASQGADAERPIEILAFGHVGYGTWLASDTFDAITGRRGAPWFGGGVRLIVKQQWFIDAAIERLQQTGQRVFVSDGEVFPLGIAETIRVVPIYATVGYRHPWRRFVPYAGGGAGVYLYKDTSEFSDPSENVDRHFVSYHALAGIELFRRDWLRLAAEVQFTSVPNALGDAGASAAFNQHNLGGVQIRVKVLAGR